MKKNLKLFLALLFIIGMIGSIPIILQRVTVERSNNIYEYVVDSKSILSLKNDEKVEEVYSTLKDNDVNTITFDNLSIKELAENRNVKYLKVEEYMGEKDQFGYPFKNFIPEYAKKDNIVTIFDKNDFLESEMDLIKLYLNNYPTVESRNNILFYIDKPMMIDGQNGKALNPVLTIRFFIDQKNMEIVSNLGFNPMLSIYNEEDEVVQEMLLEQILDCKEVYDIDKMQIRYKTMFGQPKNTSKYLEILKTSGIDVVTTEFQTSIGLTPYLENGLDMIIRGHEVKINELKLSNSELSDRITLGIKDRNMRVIVLRDFINLENDETIYNSVAGLMSSLKDSKEKLDSGYKLGNANPYKLMEKSTIGNIFVAIASASLVGLLIISIFEKNTKLAIIGAVITFIGAVFVVNLNISLGIKLYALGMSIIGAVGAIIIPSRSKIRSIPVNYILTSIIATLSGILVTCILYGTDYLVKLSEFKGVKMLYILPPILVFIWLLIGSGIFNIKVRNKNDLNEYMRNIVVSIKNIKWYTYIIAIVALIGMFVYVKRSGNSGNASDLELSIRRFLEDVLYVRPRTKEFMLGYPAVLLSYYLLKEKINYGQYMLVPAAIGTMSTVNTFTHLHTPILYCLLRTFYGVLFGAIVGMVYIFVFKNIRKFVIKEKK